ncbi:MAG: TetR/AcrR family transcriptional regulator, partial [Myxococcales bacterium]|nr:TetR/AcrR family transcriptional regulator [Myxococcales bacterium]
EHLIVAMDRCKADLKAARSSQQVTGAYQRLALTLAIFLADHPDVIRLYLQENRGPGSGDRRPVKALSSEVGRLAIELTELAIEGGLIRDVTPAVSALAVVGAAERLILALMAEDLTTDPITAANGLVSMVIDGLGVNLDDRPEQS